jgi:catechol-2,3-dioxygenase
LRRLLRARDRMDAASHEEWAVSRLASVSGVSEAHFARSFKQAFGGPEETEADLYVRDKDEALQFYVDKLGFKIHMDARNGDYRWLTGQHPDQRQA